MPHKCPECSAEIAGVVPQETMTARLKAKDGEIQALKAKITETSDKLATLDDLQSRAADAERQLAEYRREAEIVTALSAKGVPLDDKTKAGIRALYDSAVAGEDEPKSFADWLATDAAEHPLLSHVLQPSAPATSAPGVNAPSAGTQHPPRVMPSAERGVSAEPSQRKMTPRELQAYFQSAEYRQMPKEKQQEIQAQLRSQLLK